MNTKLSTNCKLIRMFANILSIVVMLAMAFPVTGSAYAAPVAANKKEPIGDKISVYFGGSITFPAGEPFHIRHGFVATSDDDALGILDFELEVDGVLRQEDFKDFWAESGDPDTLQRRWVFNFPDGMTETHTYTGHWFEPCQQAVNAGTYDGPCSTPNAKVETHSATLTIEFTITPPEMGLRVNYGDDWVESFYQTGHDVSITVTDQDGNIKATANAITEQKGYWGGEPGFQSMDTTWFDAEGNPMGMPPNIRPHDWIYASVDNGINAQLQIGEIRGVVDVTTDSIEGNILAPWFEDQVPVECLDWGSGGGPFNKDAGSILANGEESYFCNWNPELDWDIQAGQAVGVGYFGSDGHWVANVFRNPHIHVYPEQDYVDADEWVEGVTVNAWVDEKDECKVAGIPTYPSDNPWTTFVSMPFPETCDLAPGDLVYASNGVTTVSHTIRNLAFADVNKVENTVTGTADIGELVYAWVHGYGETEEQLLVTDGSWVSHFNGFDLVEGMCGRSEIRDEVGNTTGVDWCIPNPHFSVFPEWEYIEGWEWPQGAVVHMTIDDPSTDVLPDFSQDEPVLPTDWDPNQFWVRFNFAGDYDMKAGDVVTLTDGLTPRIHTVRNLAVTAVDEAVDTVSGTADPFETVYVWQHEPGPQIPFEANASGEWLADLSGAYDIHPGSGGRSEIRDEFSNATAVDWYVPNPRFSVFPEWEYVEGWEWPEGATVYASIEGKSVCSAKGTAGYSGDPITFVQMWFPAGCDAVVGDVVTLTDNETTRQYTIQNLAVTGVNADEDTVSGTADAGVQVHVWPHGYNEFLPTADADGNWTADFTDTGPDLMGGMGGRTEIRDDVGNATAVEWWVPVTFVVTSIADVLDNDGMCTLREAIIAANTNAPSGDMNGECSGGMDNVTDTILLGANEIYSLTISGSDENESYSGDLDIRDNSAATDLIIMVEGNDSATITQDAVVDDRVLENHGATVKIEGLTITSGSNVDLGGGVHNTGTLTINVSEINGNMANRGGGLFNDSDGTLTLINSLVSENSANIDGGGIWNFGTLMVDASRISANSTTYNGGGLFNYKGTAIIQNGSIVGGDPGVEGNLANLGGGMTVWSGSVTIDASTVFGNSVSWDGAGVRIMNAGALTINNSVISCNSADHAGGGILNNGVLTINSSYIQTNWAQFGGGLYNTDTGAAELMGTDMSDNMTASNGGGVENHGTLAINSSRISTNGTNGSGGGILNFGNVTIQSNSEVNGNHAGWTGGGIFNTNTGTLTADSSSISNNTSAVFGGGIMNQGMLTVSNSEIRANSTPVKGGGITNEGTLIVDHSVLSGNSAGNLAGGQGGALYNFGTATIRNGTLVGGATSEDANLSEGGGGLFSLGTLTVEDSIVTGNQANYGGGLFNWIGGMLTINNSTISNNSANEGGGLHNKEGSTAIIQNGSVFSGNYAEWGGGAIDNWGTITITGSVLRENMSPGVGDAIASGVFADSSASITGSCIVGNGDIAVFTNLTTLLNATSNWWGDASGPSGAGPGTGDSVSDFIDFAGWLIEPPSICDP